MDEWIELVVLIDRNTGMIRFIVSKFPLTAASLNISSFTVKHQLLLQIDKFC